jgi:hypothetical protein
LRPFGGIDLEHSKPQFAFLPYLRTRERCTIRGIEFRSINDVADLDAEMKGHVTTLGRMFFTCQNGRIADPTFAIIPCADSSHSKACDRHLVEAQMLVGYLYGSHHPSPTLHDDIFLEAECSTLFTFSPNRVAADLVAIRRSEIGNGRVVVEGEPELEERDFIDGYDGWRNGTVGLSAAEGSRIYPEVPTICLNYSQYLDSDLLQFLSAPQHWPFRALFGRHEMSVPNQNRVFTALMWYIRSCRGTAGGSERLLSLAIALETLLALENGERLSERFKEAVLVLVGPVPRLDDWLDQFYRARSKTVHEGRTPQLLFATPVAKKGALPHRALIVYGRRVFRICLTAVLSGILLTEESRIASLLIHNNERLAEMCKRLSEEAAAPNDRLLGLQGTIEELHQCETLSFTMRLEEDIDRLFGTVRRFMSVYEVCERIEDPEFSALFGSILESRGSTSRQTTFEALGRMREFLRKEVRQERKGSAADEIALRFVEFASRPAVGVESHLLDRRDMERASGGGIVDA